MKQNWIIINTIVNVLVTSQVLKKSLKIPGIKDEFQTGQPNQNFHQKFYKNWESQLLNECPILLNVVNSLNHFVKDCGLPQLIINSLVTWNAAKTQKLFIQFRNDNLNYIRSPFRSFTTTKTKATYSSICCWFLKDSAQTLCSVRTVLLEV